MILNKIEDPRDNLEKARLWELEAFAAANRVTEVRPGMPAILIRKILRSKGVTRIRIPPRQLGALNGGGAPLPTGDEKVVEADASDDLMRQWLQQQAAPPPAAIPPAPEPVALDETTDINVLRRMCQARDIKMSRRDRRPDLIAKIRAHDAHHSDVKTV